MIKVSVSSYLVEGLLSDGGFLQPGYLSGGIPEGAKLEKVELKFNAIGSGSDKGHILELYFREKNDPEFGAKIKEIAPNFHAKLEGNA